MAIRFATEYGVHDRFSQHGDRLIASNGNGELHGEDVKVESLRVNTRLSDIMELRAQMAMSPMEGDTAVSALLDLDEQLLATGKIDHKLITDLYPDIGEYLYRLLLEDDAAAEAMGEALETSPSTPVFPDSADAVLSLLEGLAAEQADRVLGVLISSGIDQQVQQHHQDTPLQAPLVAA